GQLREDTPRPGAARGGRTPRRLRLRLSPRRPPRVAQARPANGAPGRREAPSAARVRLLPPRPLLAAPRRAGHACRAPADRSLLAPSGAARPAGPVRAGLGRGLLARRRAVAALRSPYARLGEVPPGPPARARVRSRG